MTNNLKFVITRPQTQGLQLQQALQAVGITSICQPLFQYQQATSQQQIAQQLQGFAPAIVIFISAAAVEFADQAWRLNHWLTSDIEIIAVGSATKAALAKRDISAICPDSHDSEGILALAQLKQLDENKNILIVRGDGGRELLASELTKCGAAVQYLESYQRAWLNVSTQDISRWQQENISGIIITSNALLQRVVELVNINDKFWQNTCLWLVASERIKQTATQLGLHKVINTHGASDQAIIKTLQTMGSDND